MNKNGPIVVIEDDADDRFLFETAIRDTGYTNQILLFEDGDAALACLRDASIYPFLILSDVNLPKMDGFQIRKTVQTSAGLQEKCIPYVFISTSVTREAVVHAYNLSAQGFFMKPHSMDELRSTIKLIMDYWKVCYAPR